MITVLKYPSEPIPSITARECDTYLSIYTNRYRSMMWQVGQQSRQRCLASFGEKRRHIIDM